MPDKLTKSKIRTIITENFDEKNGNFVYDQQLDEDEIYDLMLKLTEFRNLVNKSNHFEFIVEGEIFKEI